jgi:hypothetical protein
MFQSDSQTMPKSTAPQRTSTPAQASRAHLPMGILAMVRLPTPTPGM